MKVNRKFYGKMLEWKRHLADQYALLVEGARRVGKTYLVSQFVESEYETFVYIDFSLKNKVTKESKRAFEEESTIEDTIERLAVIQTGVDRSGFFRGHLPERIFDDDRRIVTDAELKEKVSF